ncbi:unnamed protein product [Cuscuta campestris]|uniref:Uncharacterized protein n=1 Tax=Cuscuta campestris TaxID=132261 RepID=A0A484NBD4_9ASTE|nr:unnamed protein product [Cuscuta campestris]
MENFTNLPCRNTHSPGSMVCINFFNCFHNLRVLKLERFERYINGFASYYKVSIGTLCHPIYQREVWRLHIKYRSDLAP